MLRKIAFMIAGAGGLSLAALSPVPGEAASVHLNAGIAPQVDSDVVQVRHRRCHRRWNSGWGCRYNYTNPQYYSYSYQPNYYRPYYSYRPYYRPYYRWW
jgi:hypothetical protein